MERGEARPLAVGEPAPGDAARPRLLARFRGALRARHYSRRTEEAYVAWMRRYIIFHGKRHPVEMGAAEVTQFLSSLAVEGGLWTYTRQDMLQGPAAYLGSTGTGASSATCRAERACRGGERFIRIRDTLQDPAAYPPLRWSAYPVAEF